MIGNGNGHVNNLLNSTTKLTKGWKIDVSNGKWTKNQNADVVEEKCGKNAWYGWTRLSWQHQHYIESQFVTHI